jgi:hypothetical protein
MYEEGKTKAIGDSKSSCGDRVNERWRLQRKGNVITNLTEHKVTSLSRCVPDIHSWLAGFPAGGCATKSQTHNMGAMQASKKFKTNELKTVPLSNQLFVYFLFPLFCHNLT